MNENNQQMWDEIIKDDIENLKNILSSMEVELLKYPGYEAFNYLKPLRYMAIEALRDLYKLKHDRINNTDEIIKNMANDA